MENIAVFREFGFDIDELNNELVFRAVPDFDFRRNVKEVVLEMIEDLKNDKEIRDLRENILIFMSCRGAYNGGSKTGFRRDAKHGEKAT